MVMSDGAPTEEEKAAATRATKRLSLRRETVLQWLHSTTAAGGMRQRGARVTLQILIHAIEIGVHIVGVPNTSKFV